MEIILGLMFVGLMLLLVKIMKMGNRIQTLEGAVKHVENEMTSRGEHMLKMWDL